MVVCVATAKMSEFMTQLSYEREGVQVSYSIHPPLDVTVRTEEHIKGFCMKCHNKYDMKNPRHIIMKNMRRAIQGICPKCGTKMVKFG
jgi:RNase P subunit RPR2